MNVHVFGLGILAAGILVLAIGGFLWVTGVPDDGRYHVQAANPLELIGKNRHLIERRNAAHAPLSVGGIVAIVGLACVVAARRSESGSRPS